MRSSGRAVLAPLALLVAGFAVYANTLRSPFVFDDVVVIADSVYVHDLRYAGRYFTEYRAFSTAHATRQWRPLTMLAHALCWRAGRGATWPFHVYKVLLHVLAAWLVFLIGARLIGEPRHTPFLAAYLAAAFFLVHPGLHETVNYISATSTLQAGVLYLAAFWFFLAFTRAKGTRRALRAAAIAILYAAALLTKEESATLPAAMGLYSLLMEREGAWPRRLARIWPALALCLAVLAAFFAAYHFLGIYPSRIDARPDLSYLLTQLRAWVHYLVWVFTPWGYSIEHAEFGFSEHLHEPRVLASAGFVALLTQACLRLARARDGREGLPLIAFCWAVYLVALLPASSVFPLNEPINEHRYYVSYAFLFIGLAYAACRVSARLPENRARAAGWLAAVALGGLAFDTAIQNRTWRSALSVWSNTVTRDPTNSRARSNLALAYLNGGELANGLRELDECVARDPDYAPCLVNEYVYHSKQGELDLARRYLERAMAADPAREVTPPYHARYLLEVEKNYDKALEAARLCDERARGASLECIELLEKALAAIGRHKEAAEQARRRQSLDPASPDKPWR